MQEKSNVCFAQCFTRTNTWPSTAISFAVFPKFLRFVRSLALSYSTIRTYVTAQKLKFSIEDFFSKCDRICSFLRKLLNVKLHFLCSVSSVRNNQPSFYLPLAEAGYKSIICLQMDLERLAIRHQIFGSDSGCKNESGSSLSR